MGKLSGLLWYVAIGYVGWKYIYPTIDRMISSKTKPAAESPQQGA